MNYPSNTICALEKDSTEETLQNELHEDLLCDVEENDLHKDLLHNDIEDDHSVYDAFEKEQESSFQYKRQ